MTPEQRPRPVHFVGSIPLANAREVFEQVGARVGACVHAIPDGETGERLGWIRWQRERLLRPGVFELVAAGSPPRVTHELRIRSGCQLRDVKLRPLGYVEQARKSYEDFVRVRAARKVPSAARLQVSIPTPLALTTGISGSILELSAAFQEALVEEVQELCETIPARDLAVQWDMCVETVAEEGRRHPGAAKPNARPLKPGCQLYLGLVHQEDGVAGARRRIDVARKVVDDFGVATECGLGRLDPGIVPALLDLHRKVAQLR